MYKCSNCNNKQEEENNGFCLICGDNIKLIQEIKKEEPKLVSKPKSKSRSKKSKN